MERVEKAKEKLSNDKCLKQYAVAHCSKTGRSNGLEPCHGFEIFLPVLAPCTRCAHPVAVSLGRYALVLIIHEREINGFTHQSFPRTSSHCVVLRICGLCDMRSRLHWQYFNTVVRFTCRCSLLCLVLRALLHCKGMHEQQALGQEGIDWNRMLNASCLSDGHPHRHLPPVQHLEALANGNSMMHLPMPPAHTHIRSGAGGSTRFLCASHRR